MDTPEGANEHCPGAQSDNAGKASACAGCPNQRSCASGDVRGPDPALETIQTRMASVRRKLFVMSGKGGVGKSTLTNLLARSLARRFKDKTIALLDLDICGPSQPKMMGAENEQVHRSGSGWSPVFVEDNLALMSIGFLLSSADEAVIWRGPKKNSMIQQFLSEVDWGETVDYLVLDTPPGTSDEHISSASYLAGSKSNGSVGGAQAILVTTPSEVSVADVRRQITFCQKVGIEVLGLVENMAGFVCPKCTSRSEIFPNDFGGGEHLCEESGVPLLASLPIDPRVTRACDEGNDPWETCDGSSPFLNSLDTLVDKIIGAS